MNDNNLAEAPGPAVGIDRQIIRGPELLITSGEAIRGMRSRSVSAVTVCQRDKGHGKGPADSGFHFSSAGARPPPGPDISGFRFLLPGSCRANRGRAWADHAARSPAIRCGNGPPLPPGGVRHLPGRCTSRTRYGARESGGEGALKRSHSVTPGV
ncbi:hypothetical protein AAFF_G00049630 [Aldrovandia affinis]|uniref:Uncharacterized protein n=1 Tax=Aldrovandia affinis TaxID=143900 RepID=A0AAD7S1F3_9TELE|nr:hypothetical protein AAFF_G00049630 [Aldrovandia affinis]